MGVRAGCQDAWVHGGHVEWSTHSLMPGSSRGSGARGVEQGGPDMRVPGNSEACG